MMMMMMVCCVEVCKLKLAIDVAQLLLRDGIFEVERIFVYGWSVNKMA